MSSQIIPLPFHPLGLVLFSRKLPPCVTESAGMGSVRGLLASSIGSDFACDKHERSVSWSHGCRPISRAECRPGRAPLSVGPVLCQSIGQSEDAGAVSFITLLVHKPDSDRETSLQRLQVGGQLHLQETVLLVPHRLRRPLLRRCCHHTLDFCSLRTLES